MATPQGRVRFDYEQPAENFFNAEPGITVRQYLRERLSTGANATELAGKIGVTTTAMMQAAYRDLSPRTVIRKPLGINWAVAAVRVVGNKHPLNPHGVSLINWCSDCLDEECYTLAELAKMVGCQPAELLAEIDKYQAEFEDEDPDGLDEEKPVTDHSNIVTCYDHEEERLAREAECVNATDNIGENSTPTETSDIDGFSIDPPAPQIGEALPHGVTRVGAELIADGQWHTTMLSALAETAPDALSAFLRVTGQEDLFRGFMLGYEARGEEAA